ncbi:MAG: helicase RepA family protein [Phycisphaerae bacterium]|nr:helicase RepA family protein [Phycisphaerae bacterium]
MVALNTQKQQEYEQHYRDNICRDDTDESRQAERAFRQGFLEEARRVIREWIDPDDGFDPWGQQETAHKLRLKIRERYSVYAPGEAGRKTCHLGWRDGYVVAAARARGRHHALAYIIQAWDDVDNDSLEYFDKKVLSGWLKAVEAWAQMPANPHRPSPPPRPLETDDVTEILCESHSKEASLETVISEPIGIKPQFRNVRELMKEFPSLHPPLIEGLLREGETMNIIASPKMGKSWLVTDLALSVATGRPWLGCYETHRGDVLILDNELHSSTTANRIPRVAKARGFPLEEYGQHVFVDNLRGRLADIDELGLYFAQCEVSRFKMIVLDAFYRFMPSGSDENDNAKMASVYNTIDRYAQRLGASFILIHHTTKGSQTDKSVTDVGAGAGSQSRAADTHLVLRPHEEQGAVVLDAAVRSWPPIEPQSLRWTFPVYDYDDDLDPADLKRPTYRRRKKYRTEKAKSEKPAEQQWTPERFIEAFITDQPIERGSVLLAATSAGLSMNRSKLLLGVAEGKSLAYRWTFGANRKVKVATIPQPIDKPEEK